MEKKDLTTIDEQGLSIGGIKERLDMHSKLMELVPESLKYYSVQYLDQGKIKNQSCFDRTEAEAICKRLGKANRQFKLIEGTKAAGVNMFARSVGCEEVPELTVSTNNLEEVSRRLAEGKPAVLFVYEKRAVRGKDGKPIFGSACGSSYISGQYLNSLDKVFHSVLGKVETRAQARAASKWLGVPLVIAEDFEAAETTNETELKTVVDGSATVKVDKPTTTSPEERNSSAQALLDEIHGIPELVEQLNSTKDAKEKKELSKQIEKAKDDKKKLVAKMKKDLGLKGSLKDAAEEIYQRFMKELEQIKAEKSEEI
jgi:hypothetical protein